MYFEVKLRHPCNEDWKDYDDIVEAKHTSLVGCKAPYQRRNASIRHCITDEEMKKSVLALRSDDYGLPPPCKSLEKVSCRIEYDRYEEENEWKRDGAFWMGLHFPQQFKEIEETR